MTANTHMLDNPSTVGDAGNDKTSPTFLDRWFKRALDARAAQGERRARNELRSLSPEILAGVGLTPAEIAQVRQTGRLPQSFWAR